MMYLERRGRFLIACMAIGGVVALSYGRSASRQVPPR
jgi:hypothetical protein